MRGEKISMQGGKNRVAADTKTADMKAAGPNTAGDVIYLVSCAVNGTAADKARVDAMDLDQVFAFSYRHMLSALVSSALLRAGCRDRRAPENEARAARREAVFADALEKVKKSLREKDIWFMPLKGAVLKHYYPGFGLREYADCDILFDASHAAKVRALMEEQGYTTEHFGAGPHDVYHKAPFLNFEMHRSLFSPGFGNGIYEYFADLENRLCGEGPEKHFTPGDFYLYILAHEYKHYSKGGTGLRSLVDTYMFLKAEDPDRAYVEAAAAKLGLAEFEKKNRSLALHLFAGEELTAEDQEMLAYVLGSGVYGNISNRVKNSMRDHHWNRLQYMLDRFSVPVRETDPAYTAYAAQYPLFYRHKLLLPVLPLYRTLRSAKDGRFLKELKAIIGSGTDTNNK